MSDLKVKNTSFLGEIKVPTSKSVAHRLIIASAILGSQVSILGDLNSKDILATINAIKELGASVKEIEGGVEITAQNLSSTNKTFDVMESGSTMRFLLPLLAVYGKNYSLRGSGRIGERTIKALKNCMENAGVSLSNDYLPLTACGKYNGNIFSINPKDSSQFISGMLFTLFALGGGELKIEGPITSKGYVDITVQILEKLGANITFSGDKFILMRSNAPMIKELEVNGDWSSACFWIVAGVLSGNIKLKGLTYPDAQPDSVIIDLIKKMGGKVYFEGQSLVVEKSGLKAIDFDADGSPDIVPILSVACAFADGVSTITGVERLRIKESDRVQSVCDMLKAVGVRVESGKDYIRIWGNSTLTSGIIDSVNDHRIAMSGMILGSLSPKGAVVKGVECVSKSYPNFIEDFAHLGGQYEQL